MFWLIGVTDLNERKDQFRMEALTRCNRTDDESVGGNSGRPITGPSALKKSFNSAQSRRCSKFSFQLVKHFLVQQFMLPPAHLWWNWQQKISVAQYHLSLPQWSACLFTVFFLSILPSASETLKPFKRPTWFFCSFTPLACQSSPGALHDSLCYLYTKSLWQGYKFSDL